METAFYFYTIVVMLVCVASGSVSLSAYFVSRRHSFLYAAAMLLFYFLDLALIFQYEYLGQNVEYSINQFYTIDHPQLKILLALGTLEPMWLILCDFVNERRRVLLPLPQPWPHSGKRNRRAVPARGRVSPMALLHAAPDVSPVVLGFRGLSLLHGPQRSGEGPLAPSGAAVPRHFSSVPVHSHRGCRHDPRLRFQLLRERRYAAPIYQRAELL